MKQIKILLLLVISCFMLVSNVSALVNVTGGTVMSPSESNVNYIAPDPYFLCDGFTTNETCLYITNFQHPSPTFSISNGTNITLCILSDAEINIILGSSTFIVNIFDAMNNSLIENVDFEVEMDKDGLATISQTTSTGVTSFAALEFGKYVVQISSSGYGTRRYYVSITNATTSTLNAYMLLDSASNDIVFTVKDIDVSTLLEGIRVTLFRKIGASFISVAQRNTDFVGTALFDMEVGEGYKMTFSNEIYFTKNISIEIEPTDTAFTILLSKNISTEFSTIFSDIKYTFYPLNAILSPILNFNFSFTVLSQNGTLNWFSLSTTFNGSVINNVSGVPAGGTAIVSRNLSGFEGESFNFEYCISSSFNPFYCFNNSYIINPVRETNLSLTSLVEDSKTLAGLITSISSRGFLILNILSLLIIGLLVATMSVSGMGGRTATGIGVLLLVGAGLLGTFNLFISFLIAFVYFTSMIVLRVVE